MASASNDLAAGASSSPDAPNSDEPAIAAVAAAAAAAADTAGAPAQDHAVATAGGTGASNGVAAFDDMSGPSMAAIAAAYAGGVAARSASPAAAEPHRLQYEVRIVSGNANRPLSQSIARLLSIPMTDAEVGRFKDGECNVSIKENVRGADVFVVQSTSPPVNDNLMELLVVIDALKRASARRITAVIPYYGYARQDRKAAPRVPITARLVADLITAAGAHRVLAFELHAGQIQGFFNIPVDHMFANPVFAEYFRQKGLPHDLVVVSPDAGGIVRARALAKRLDASLAIVDKRRATANVAEVMRVIGDVNGLDCIIIDDIVDTAGTLTEAAKALAKHGAKSVRACCVHAVLSGPAIDRLQQSPISKLVVTDSIELSPDKRIDKIEVVTVGPLIAETIRRVHCEESVSNLFEAERA